MAEPVGSLRVDVAANAAQIRGDMQQIKGIVNSAANEMRRSFTAFGNGANRAMGEIFNLRNAALGFATGALVTLIRNSVKYGAHIDDTSTKLGIAADKYQELSYAAKIAGVEQEDFDKALEQFEKRLGAVGQGSSAATATLGKLGISLASLKGMTVDQKLNVVADAIQRIPDPMQRAAIMTELFGKAGIKMALVLGDGAAGLAKYADEAHRLGFILSTETIKKAAEADDEFDRIGKSLKVAGVNISAGFLPALTEIRRLVTSQDFQDGVQTLASNLGSLIRWMVDNKDTITTVATAFAGMRLGAAFGSAFGKQGAVLGGLTGAVAGLAAGAALTTTKTKELENELATLEKTAQGMRDSLAKNPPTFVDGNAIQDLQTVDARIAEIRAQLDKLKAAQTEPTRVTVNKSPTIDTELLDEITRTNKEIDELSFKTRIARQDFRNLADGFPESAHQLKAFGTETRDAATEVSKLPAHLQRLNAEMLKFKGAQLTQEMLTPVEKYNDEMARLAVLLGANAISQETFNRKVFQMRDQLRQSTGMGADLTAVAKGTGDAFTTAFDDAIAHAKSFQDILKSLIQDLLKVVTRNLVTAPLGGAISNLVGGILGVPGGGQLPKFATGGSFEVGGSGAIDSKLVAFHATPGEMVNISKGDSGPAGGGITQYITNEFSGGINGNDMAAINAQIGEASRTNLDAMLQVLRTGLQRDPHFLG